MASLAAEAFLALAMKCSSLDSTMIAAIGLSEVRTHEPLAIHDNTTGQSFYGPGVIARAKSLIASGHSVDMGPMQINSKNLNMLGESVDSVFDTCGGIRAATKLLQSFSRYNCGKPDGCPKYAAGTWANYRRLRADNSGQPSVNVSEVPNAAQCAAPAWDVWGSAECQESIEKERAHDTEDDLR